MGAHTLSHEVGMLDILHNRVLLQSHIGLVNFFIVIVASIISLDFGDSGHHGQRLLADYAHVPEVLRETHLVKGMFVLVVAVVVAQ